MARCVPTLGYPTRTAAVLALRAQGKSNQDIARAAGISTNHVAQIYSMSVRQTTLVRVSRGTLERLRPLADKRRVAVEVLAQQIIETVAAENLAEAVLDDGQEPQ